VQSRIVWENVGIVFWVVWLYTLELGLPGFLRSFYSGYSVYWVQASCHSFSKCLSNLIAGGVR
jgi:hypothetical protein